MILNFSCFMWKITLSAQNWNIYYNDIGTFEAHFDLKNDTLPLVMENDYLIAVQGKHAAIIVGKKLGSDLTIYGRICNWLLTKRITASAFKESGTRTLFDLLKAKINDGFPETNFVIGENVSTSKTSAERSDRVEIFKLVQELLEQELLGHELEFDFTKSRFVFQMLKGNGNNPLVISTANRNAYDVTMNSDLLELYTGGFYKEKMKMALKLGKR